MMRSGSWWDLQWDLLVNIFFGSFLKMISKIIISCVSSRKKCVLERVLTLNGNKFKGLKSLACLKSSKVKRLKG